MSTKLDNLIEEFKTKTNKELQEYCDKNEIKVKAKNAKPNKTELLTAIADFMSTQVESPKETLSDVLDDVETQFDDETKPVEFEDNDDLTDFDPFAKVKNIGKKKSEEELKKEAVKRVTGLKKLVRVQISLNSEIGTKVKHNQMFHVSWGNAVVGSINEIFPIGKPWHLTQGSVNQLEQIMYQLPLHDSRGNVTGYRPIKKYYIQKLPQLSKQQLKELAKKQLVRDAQIN